jgi:hypothetical protein
MYFITQLCEKLLFGAFALCFSFVCLYTPQPVHAGGPLGGATEPTQILNNIMLGVQAGYEQISSLASTAMSLIADNTWIKENLLDGIGWSLAKGILSQMTAQIIDWVNSGFKGSPAFVTDMSGLLRDVADREFGAFLEDLGGPFSFVCAPFKLDVQVAVSITYERYRANKGIQTPATCTLSGALANIDSFIDGTTRFVDASANGGWDTWFKVTMNPTQYTPAGSVLEAEAQARARIVNARGEEVKLLEFGEGFLSSKVCETVDDESGGHSVCGITTPGKVINEALTFQTSSGPRALIEADEINEILTAVFSQLTQQAITGTMGLLGLSPNTGYGSGTSYTSGLAGSAYTSDPESLYTIMMDAVASERGFAEVAREYQIRFEDYADDITNDATRRNDARTAMEDIEVILVTTAGNDATINALIAELDNLRDVSGVIIPNPTDMQRITDDYFKVPVYSSVEIDGNIARWEVLLRD